MKTMIRTLLIIAVLAASVLAQTDARAELAKWRAEHEAEISKIDGWLSLAGLFWLKEGANRVGRGDGFDVSLTESSKNAFFGRIELTNGVAELWVEPGVEAFANGVRIGRLKLETDENKSPTIVEYGSQSFFLIKRGDQIGVRLRDRSNKSLREFTGLKWFRYDRRYRVEARLEKFSEEMEILVANVLGGNFKMKSPGILKFRLRGRSYSLQPVTEGDKLLIVFRDLTSRRETYGAGRFLYAKPDENGRVVLDFNRAENPPCAFTTFATCPLPPPQNRLRVSIPAGEKRYH